MSLCLIVIEILNSDRYQHFCNKSVKVHGTWSWRDGFKEKAVRRLIYER